MRLPDRLVKNQARGVRIAAVLCVAAALEACAPIARPVISHRGFVNDPEAVASVRIGIDNKNSVTTRLGTPTTTASFDGTTWYYISQTQKDFLFHRPKTVKEDVIAIKFDSKNLVSQIDHYGTKDERHIAYVSRTTPTRGKELTFLEQMFGNFGRFSSDNTGESPRPQ